MCQSSTANWDYRAESKKMIKALHLSAKASQRHVPLPDTLSDLGDNSSDTSNAGTDLNSRSYQIMLAGWAAECLYAENRLVHRMELLGRAPPWRTYKQKPEQILPTDRDNPADQLKRTSSPLTECLLRPRTEDFGRSGIFSQPICRQSTNLNVSRSMLEREGFSRKPCTQCLWVFLPSGSQCYEYTGNLQLQCQLIS